MLLISWIRLLSILANSTKRGRMSLMYLFEQRATRGKTSLWHVSVNTYVCSVLAPKLSRAMRFSLGKICCDCFAPCKSIDILQLCFEGTLKNKDGYMGKFWHEMCWLCFVIQSGYGDWWHALWRWAEWKTSFQAPRCLQAYKLKNWQAIRVTDEKRTGLQDENMKRLEV